MVDDRISYGRCPACGYLMFPILPASPCGHEVEPDVVALADVGVVYSHTRVWTGDNEPVDLVMADFRDGRLRVNAPLLGLCGVRIGDMVRVVPGRTTPYALEPVHSTARGTSGG